jgi:hypothetical protein
LSSNDVWPICQNLSAHLYPLIPQYCCIPIFTYRPRYVWVLLVIEYMICCISNNADVYRLYHVLLCTRFLQKWGRGLMLRGQ